MRVLVHDRTEGLPSRVVEYAERRLTRLSRHFDRVIEAQVEFAPESRRTSAPACSVQITVRTDGRRHALAHAHETAGDPRAALDLALDKVDRQVVRLKEKIKIERKRSPAAGAEPEPAAETTSVPERIRLKLHPESLDDAAAALDEGDQPFYVFLDESSGTVGVCFRKPDGGLAVVEPVVP